LKFKHLFDDKNQAIKKSTDCGKLKVICSHFSLKMSGVRHEKANQNRDLIS
jgi:hypothetical protein